MNIMVDGMVFRLDRELEGGRVVSLLQCERMPEKPTDAQCAHIACELNRVESRCLYWDTPAAGWPTIQPSQVREAIEAVRKA